MMTLSSRNDPYVAFNFIVEIDGLIVGGFNEIGGLDLQIEYFQYHEGGGAGIVYHLPRKPKYGKITLSRGIGEENVLLDWVLTTAQGEIQPRQVSIILKNIQPEMAQIRWDLANALPKEWSCGVFNAQHSRVAIETLALVFTSLKRETHRVDTIENTYIA
ncbi:MAG: phage tail protein [Gammaproteobacteria bacterium]|nr:phage tail protein [Gammaproteobacteria bacterium]